MGIVWIFFAALLLGLYALPSKFTKNSTCENMWGSFIFFAMFVVPLGSAIISVNGLWEILVMTPISILALMMGLSMFWGVGIILFGVGIKRLGMGLGFTMFIGTLTLVGSILPFLLGDITRLKTPGGSFVIAGVIVILFGIVTNGKAGVLKERTLDIEPSDSAGEKNNLFSGIAICVIGGVCASGFNIAYSIGNDVSQIGVVAQSQFHNTPVAARLAVMTPIFFASGIISSIYFCWMLTRNKTWKLFFTKESPINMAMGMVMALSHDGGLIFYGVGALLLGSAGTSVGFAILQVGSIMIANISGIACGEWREADNIAKRWMYAGLSVMAGGICIISYGNSLLS